MIGLLIRLLGWLIRRVGSQTLLLFTLLLVALGSVALGLADAVRGLDAGLLLPVAVLGLLIGWGLAKSPLPGWLGSLVVFGLGIEVMFLRVGRLSGVLMELLGALIYSAIKLVYALIWGIWRFDARGEVLPDIGPILVALRELWAGISTLLIRVREWSLELAMGELTFDLVAVALVWGLALWIVAAWAGWCVRRRGKPLRGLVPAGALLAANLYYLWGNPAFLLPLLGTGLLLVAWVGQSARERRWEAIGVDFPFDVGLEVVFAGAALSLVLTMMAMLTPSVSLQEVIDWVGRLSGKQAGEVRVVASSLESDSQAHGPPTVFDQDTVRAPGLPRRHLLGSGPELSEQVVMVICTEGDKGTDGGLRNGSSEAVLGESAPRYYWRSLTYDRYTGRGWGTGQTETVEYQAGDLAIYRNRFEPPGVEGQTVLGVPFGRRKVRLEVRAAGDLGGLLHTAGDLVTVDQDYRVAWRSSEDAFGAILILTERVARTEGVSKGAAEDIPIVYRADSLVPIVGEMQLRAAGSDYPAWVRSRYLAVPEKVPARVLALARDLTATAPTPYDRARAIEAYLRTFPYSLDLPSPPVDRDVVDYFLYDLQQGYCDYYASSMVILARAAGLPARLAVGYYSGTYDEANACYVVTEADAHAWVEIYFPDYGWIEFEPTAGLPPIERPVDIPAVAPPELGALEPMITERSRGGWLWWPTLPGVGILLGLGGVVWSAFDGWRLRRLSPNETVVLLYWRLCRHGPRLAVPVRPGDTPYEFVASLAECVLSVAGTGRWGPALIPAIQEARWLADLYVRICYGPHSADDADQIQVIRTWRRLRRRLWLARMFQTWRFVAELTSVPARSARRARRLPTG